MLDKIGINARDGQLKAKNVAAVMVTANLPAFARQGSRIDVMVSALGDAKTFRAVLFWLRRCRVLTVRFMP